MQPGFNLTSVVSMLFSTQNIMRFCYFNYFSAIMPVPYFTTSDLLFTVNLIFLDCSEMYLCTY